MISLYCYIHCGKQHFYSLHVLMTYFLLPLCLASVKITWRHSHSKSYHSKHLSILLKQHFQVCRSTGSTGQLGWFQDKIKLICSLYLSETHHITPWNETEYPWAACRVLDVVYLKLVLFSIVICSYYICISHLSFLINASDCFGLSLLVCHTCNAFILCSCRHECNK